jgi:integrase
LDKNEIHDDVWTFEAYKTKKLTEIYFTGFAAPALDILKKYSYQLPKISLQKFNLQLKKAAEVAKINTPVKVRRYVGIKEIIIENPKYAFLGSHCGRRTCVSILLNDFNMNIAHVKEITGHADLDTLQKYINSDNKARREAMSQTARIDAPLKVIKSKAV